MTALVIVLVMTMMYVVPASAATLSNPTDHSYDAYQIFAGTQDSEDTTGKLGVSGWGTGIDGSAFLAALKADTTNFNKTTSTTDSDTGTTTETTANIFQTATTAADVAKILGDNPTYADKFAKEAEKHLSTTKTAIAANATEHNLAAGYYLMVDTADVSSEDDAKNLSLLEVTGKETFTIQKKYEVPSVDKSVVVNSENKEAADYSIGDTVTYEIEGTLPGDHYADYKTYKYTITDTLSKGQAFQNDLKIYINSTSGTEITDKFDIKMNSGALATTDGSSQTVFTITAKGTDNANDLKTAVPALTGSNKIIVHYTAILTADANVGSAGNENKAQIEFSNNPNNGGEGDTGETPEDKTLVFTYELDNTKVDGDNPSTKLEGAQFVLKAVTVGNDHDGKYVQIDAATGKVTGWLTDKPTVVDTVPTSGNTGVFVSASSTGLFKAIGLDAGTYELEEIKAPTGYNLLNDAITIVIAATVDDTEETGPELKTLTIKVDDEAATNGDLANGKVETTIKNYAGPVLPTTGGIGTTLFYLIGAALVVGAGVVLVTRRRVSSSEE